MIYIIEDVFLILYFVFTFWSLISSFKKDHPMRNEEKEDISRESNRGWVLELFILICAIALCFIGILYLGFKTNNKWIIILLASGALFEKIRTAHSSLKFLKKIVETDETTPINMQDSLTILGGSYILWYLAALGHTKKLFSLVELIPNETMSDLLIMVLHIILCFLYLFFIFVILQNVFYSIALFIKKITGKGYWKNIFDLIEEKLKGRDENLIESSKITFNCIQKAKRLHTVWKCMLWLIIPLLFVFDIVVTTIIFALSLLYELLKYIVLFILFLKNITIKCVNKIIELSNRHVTAILFRISIVIALVLIVVENRYHSIFKLVDSSTGILEFIASSIIIPIVFEWVNSFKKK